MGWWLYPSHSSTSSNQFARTFSEAHSGRAAMRISGYFSVDHQIYTYPDPLPVRQKAKYLVSYWYRGNLPKSDEGANRLAAKLAVVRITWIPKTGKALKLRREGTRSRREVLGRRSGRRGRSTPRTASSISSSAWTLEGAR